MPLRKVESLKVSLVTVVSLSHHYRWILGTELELRHPDMNSRAKNALQNYLQRGEGYPSVKLSDFFNCHC